jgi:phage FluMu protein Com
MENLRMKAIRCKECNKIIGYSENVEYPQDNFLCVLCTEERLKNKNKNPGGLKTATGFITIKSKATFSDFGKKPKSRLDRFFISLIEENCQPERGRFFDRNCFIYFIHKVDNELLVKITLPNNKNEYYLIRNGEIVDYYVEK